LKLLDHFAPGYNRQSWQRWQIRFSCALTSTRQPVHAVRARDPAFQRVAVSRDNQHLMQVALAHVAGIRNSTAIHAATTITAAARGHLAPASFRIRTAS
jgi:hypothetical protein